MTEIRSARTVPKSVDIAWIMNSVIMLTAIVQTGVISDFMEPTVRRVRETYILILSKIL